MLLVQVVAIEHIDNGALVLLGRASWGRLQCRCRQTPAAWFVVLENALIHTLYHKSNYSVNLPTCTPEGRKFGSRDEKCALAT